MNASEVKFYSFWKPDPIPVAKLNVHQEFSLIAFGHVDSVIEGLCQIPLMRTVQISTLSDRPIFRFLWKVETGVILYGYTDSSVSKQVYSINAVSTVKDELFLRLFSQINEHFGCVALDEWSKTFLSLPAFKKAKFGP
jgi:hypothetical protein